jgi:transposase
VESPKVKREIRFLGLNSDPTFNCSTPTARPIPSENTGKDEASRDAAVSLYGGLLDGAGLLLATIVGRFSRLLVIWGDGGYAGQLVEWMMQTFGPAPRLEIVPKLGGQHEFTVLRWRWIVERTFGWLGRFRRLSKDYERFPETSENWIRIAMTSVMLRPPASP